jgi:superfamily I DNA/RNA helicase
VQDLITGNYLSILDAVLKGGLEHGKWSFFGDFKGQALYNEGTSAEILYSLLGKYAKNYTRYTLSLNCRNTRQIGDTMLNLSPFDTEESLEKSPEGPPVKFISWKDKESERKLLEMEILRLVKTENVKSAEIQIISPHKKEHSVAALISDDKLYGIGFNTIWAYKGLENSVIIITDIESYSKLGAAEGEAARKLVYVAMSRARTALIVFESEAAKKERQKAA